MAARRRPSKVNTPLDDRQKRLLEEEERLKERAAHLNQVIKDAPRIKEERVRAQRELLLKERSSRAHQLNATTLMDTRYDQFGARPRSGGRRKPLRAERRQTRLIFLGLVVVLAVFVVWLLSVWHFQWPS